MRQTPLQIWPKTKRVLADIKWRLRAKNIPMTSLTHTAAVMLADHVKAGGEVKRQYRVSK